MPPASEGDEAVTYEDTIEYLVRIGSRQDIILVCGQAVNFWAEHYRTRVPELDREGPFSSKDTDFLGARAAVEYCARALTGEAMLARERDPLNPVLTGIVTFKDSRGRERKIDFLKDVAGVDTAEVADTAIEVEVQKDGRPTGAFVRVMHPELCLESRVHNYVHLPDRRDEHTLKQLRASIFCCREYVRDLISEGQVRDALKLNERVFTFCLRTRSVRDLLLLGGPNPFDAVLPDERLPSKFIELRYPQMIEQLARA